MRAIFCRKANVSEAKSSIDEDNPPEVLKPLEAA
jgi:hypothetical protein